MTIEEIKNLPIAKKYLPLDIDLDDLAKNDKLDTMTTSEKEKAVYDYAEQTYWSYQLMLEDGDIRYIDTTLVNTEQELEDWAEALDRRYTPVYFAKAWTGWNHKDYIVGITEDQSGWYLDLKGQDRLEYLCTRILRAKKALADWEHINVAHWLPATSEQEVA